VVCGLIPVICVPTAEWIAVAPHGDEGVLWLVGLIFVPGLFAVPGFVAAVVGLAVRRFRRQSLLLALSSAAYLVGLFYSTGLGESVRMSAFHRLAERSRPLVAAIRAFEQQQGRPPESLQELVPEFLPFVPSTGMGAYPEYEYVAPATSYDGNPWVIKVSTPSGGINFDQFLYFPLTNYPKTGYGGYLERVGAWAYVHE